MQDNHVIFCANSRSLYLLCFAVGVFVADYGWYLLLLCVGVYLVLQHLQKKRPSQNQRATPEETSGQESFLEECYSVVVFCCTCH